jgi:hypothetical protein
MPFQVEQDTKACAVSENRTEILVIVVAAGKNQLP